MKTWKVAGANGFIFVYAYGELPNVWLGTLVAANGHESVVSHHGPFATAEIAEAHGDSMARSYAGIMGVSTIEIGE